MDWSLVQSFLAVAETGSLSAAARELGQSQPTIGRHVKTLEDQLQVELFQRHARGLTLATAGTELLPHARAVRDEIQKLGLAAAGRQEAMEGTVRLTASVFFAHHVLPPILADIRRQEPDIQIELVARDESDNLLFREADIALRMYRPTQLDIVTQHLGDIAMGLFATTEIAERAGKTPQSIFDAGFIGYDANPQIIEGMRQIGLNVRREDFDVRCDHQTVYWQLVRAGCGVGFCQRSIGLADPGVREVFMDAPLPSLPVWLAAPEAMRQVPRLRRVWDMLKNHLQVHLDIDPSSPSG